MKHQKTAERIEELRNDVLDNDVICNITSQYDIEYDKAFFKAAENNCSIQIEGNIFYMVICNMNGKRYIMSIYMISTKKQTRKNKENAQIIMKIVDCLERVFVYLDRLYLENNFRRDKVSYLVAFKEISELVINESPQV